MQRIEQRIDRQRRIWLAAAFGHAAARWLTAALLAAAAVFLADWLVLRRVAETDAEDLQGRIVLLLALLLFLVWRGIRLFGAAWRARQDVDDMALRIEDHCPELEGRLISHVQFQRAADAGRYVGSPELVETVEQETVRLAGALSFAGITDTRPLRRAAMILCALVLPLLVLSFWQHETSAAFFRRLVLGNATYPAATRLVAVEAPATVPMGETFTVTAIIDSRGVVPHQSRLQVRAAISGETFSLPMPAEPATVDDDLRRFSTALENPTEDMELRVIAFDARSNWQRVRVLRRPSVLQVRLRYAFPEYTAMPPRESRQGDIRVVVGTRVSLAARTGKAIRRATLVFRPRAAAPQTLELAIQDDPTRLAGELTVRTNGTYTIQLEDTDGLANAAPPEWTVEAFMDQPPAVKVTFPAQDRMATPSARWPLRFSVKDDYGLARAYFCYEIQDPLQTEPMDRGSRDLGPVSSNKIARTSALRSWVNIAALKVLPGQQLHYWVEVTDRRLPAPNRGRSRTYTFDVADAETVQNALKSTRDTAIKQLGTLVHSQEAGRVHVDKTRRELRRAKK